MKRPIVYVNIKKMKERGVWKKETINLYDSIILKFCFYSLNTSNILVFFMHPYWILSELVTTMKREKNSEE
jgi:hypothetical protein